MDGFFQSIKWVDDLIKMSLFCPAKRARLDHVHVQHVQTRTRTAVHCFRPTVSIAHHEYCYGALLWMDINIDARFKCIYSTKFINSAFVMLWGNNSLNHRSIYLSSQKYPLAIMPLFESAYKDKINLLFVCGFSPIILCMHSSWIKPGASLSSHISQLHTETYVEWRL